MNNNGADEASVSAALARAQQARSEAGREWTKGSAARTDEVEGGAAVAGASRQNRQTSDEPAWTPQENANSSPNAWKARATATP